jgi:hypothetical protein
MGMAGDFKMHRAGPRRTGAGKEAGAGVGVLPLGRQLKRPAGRARLAMAGEAEPDKDGAPPRPVQGPVREIGGPKGPEPTRFGDWERNGICYDF